MRLKRENRIACISCLPEFFQVFLVICSLIFLGTGCTGLSNNNASDPVPTFVDINFTKVKLDVMAYNDVDSLNNLTKFATVDEGQIEIDEVRVVLDQIKLTNDVGFTSNLDTGEPLIVRLVDDGLMVNEIITDVDTFLLPAGTYESLSYKLRKADIIPFGLEDDSVIHNHLGGQSLVIEGMYTESASHDINGNGIQDSVPFRYVTNMEMKIEIETPNGIALDALKDNHLYIVFNLTNWKDGLIDYLQNLADPQFDQDNTVILNDNDDTNRDSFQEIKEKLIESTKIAQNDDGEFDAKADIDDDSIVEDKDEYDEDEEEDEEEDEDEYEEEDDNDDDDDDDGKSGNDDDGKSGNDDDSGEESDSKKVIAVKKNVIAVNKEVTAVKKEVTAVKKEVTAVKKDVTAVRKKVIAVRKKVIAVRKKVSK